MNGIKHIRKPRWKCKANEINGSGKRVNLNQNTAIVEPDCEIKGFFGAAVGKI